ncbi:DNA polymerase III subunit alpha [Frankia sp. AgB1.9]|uniref:DNA polymerase III subunit alpha n=1 Tax=unclassified Frankia TaxID=2632575 RepID=UPI0019347876|nr:MULTISPECIES: DNA polymerase III subunit alpha [unclassified Frankia]MBL7491902.1 DNA polymerase III subunit alpha [Frankia sp. AgW1.1]MBL7550191.1 DNA polymerase III subunit alpha [Frankia sp. AgB1.9]MBL7619850.1 DNA polymerase III subunit alpha [Frankia sp. AgB1.8]
MSADSFVHLHVHTEYSMLDGAAKSGLLFKEAARLGMPAVGMTDHGNMFGAYEFHQAAKKSDLKPIIGIEAYLAPESRTLKKPVFWGEGSQRDVDPDGEGGDVSGGGSYTHMTMLAENPTGLRNLFRLSSLASIEGYYRKPRMDKDLVSECAEGIIATTGCPSGEVQTRLRLGQFDKALAAAASYRDIFGAENFFLELMDHGLAIERSVRQGLLDIAKQLNIRPLATNDSHYVTEDQAESHEALLCVGTGKRLDDPKRFKFQGSGYYLKSADEMRELWDDQVPGACDSSLLIAERVQPYDEVFGFIDRMPLFPVPEGEDQLSWLRKEITRGARRRFPEGTPAEVLERIDYEVGVIEKMGFPAYFLVVADICEYARSQGIRVGPGRGSATGSMIAFIMGITELNPIEHALIFERFLNPERISPPDIDLDFDERRRGDMIRYVTEKYGDDRVCQILTFGTIKAKAAVKDSCRVLGFPYALGDQITKAMPPDVMGKGIPLSGIFDPNHDRYNEAGELRALYEAQADVRKIIDTARGLEGLTRGTGVHAAGVILCAEPLLDVLPIHRRDNDGAIITGFPFPQCEEMGLLKMDFLGLRNLTVIDDAIKSIERNRGVVIDLETLPLADDKAFQLLARGDTLGVFQLDGGPMRNLLKLMAPTKFGDIAAVLALYRPGPMAANSHIEYADRKNGRKETLPIHPELADALEPILGETYHLVVYQEQVMAIARELAGYSLGAADLLRRAMGKKKKEILDKEFARFSAGMKEKGYSDSAVQALWDVLVPFSGYGFNKSHTAGYGVVSFWTAYLKANYQAEYMAALLTSVGDDKDKMAVYLAEARKMGVKVLPPDVNQSDLRFTPVGESIRFGLGAVRNVGANVIASIVATREKKGDYTSFVDFLDKSEITVCNKRVIESLIKAGAFDSLGHNRRPLVNVHEAAVDAVIGTKRAAAIGQFDLFGDAGGADEEAKIGLDLDLSAAEWPRKERLALERDMLGLYVSSHPLEGAEKILERHRDVRIIDLVERDDDEAAPVANNGFGGAVVKVAGIISKIDRRVNKNSGAPWAIVTIEDLDAAIDCLFFPKSYEQYASALSPDAVATVSGRINEREGSVSLFAQDLTILDVDTSQDGPPILITLPTHKITSPLVEELRLVLATHPGTTPVHLRLEGPQNIHLLKLEAQVRSCSALFADLKSALGAKAISA